MDRILACFLAMLRITILQLLILAVSALLISQMCVGPVQTGKRPVCYPWCIFLPHCLLYSHMISPPSHFWLTLICSSKARKVNLSRLRVGARKHLQFINLLIFVYFSFSLAQKVTSKWLTKILFCKSSSLLNLENLSLCRKGKHFLF